MNRCRTYILVAAVALFSIPRPSSAGPPFQTDDPEPVRYRNFEAYVFGTVDRAPDGTATQGPAFEFNAGFAPNFQFHVMVPVQGVSGSRGLGDIELGVKFRFMEETKSRPQVGIFPMLELPAGSASRGLGNGRLWARLPIWIQKSSGPWTTYGGGGYIVDNAARMRNAPFAGWLLQRQLSDRLTLGGEIFYQDARSIDSRFSTQFDGGGYYAIHDALSLLFMAGHSIAGEQHTVAYLGLYYTWGAHEGAPAGAFATYASGTP